MILRAVIGDCYRVTVTGFCNAGPGRRAQAQRSPALRPAQKEPRGHPSGAMREVPAPQRLLCLKLKYIEYEVINNDLKFTDITY